MQLFPSHLIIIINIFSNIINALERRVSEAELILGAPFSNVKSIQKRGKGASITGTGEEGERRGNKPRDESDPRKIASFVDPDPMVEFDPRISRVGTRFAQVRLSSLSLSLSSLLLVAMQRLLLSLVISLALSPSIFPSYLLLVVLGISFTRRKQKEQLE